MLEVLKNSDVYNFADDNTILVAFKNRDKLLEILKNESELVVNCSEKVPWQWTYNDAYNIFESFWYYTKFSFHHKWSEARNEA